MSERIYNKNNDVEMCDSNKLMKGEAGVTAKKLVDERKESLFARNRRLNREALGTQSRNGQDKREDNAQILIDEINSKIVGGGSRSTSSVAHHVLEAIAETRGAQAATSASCHRSNRKPCIFEKNFLGKTDQIQSAELSSSLAQTSINNVQEGNLAYQVHEENVRTLNSMSTEEILKQKEELLRTLNPSIHEFLKRKAASTNLITDAKFSKKKFAHAADESAETESPLVIAKVAQDLVERSNEEKWLNFDVVETDKFKWMADMPPTLEAGEQFQARFDWNGILLPYSADKVAKSHQLEDDRHLYLHGEEPNRPGYTLQELFRLARSNVQQQRIAAFVAIGGLLNFYNQGFYDQVLELPISNIFFLLRYGLDENTQAQLEVVSRTLAYMFYNETDEILLDHIHENADCYIEPEITVLAVRNEAEQPDSLEMLQEQMEALSLKHKAMTAKVEETEDQSNTSMSDFHLAENNLVECLIRTNILQRIYYIFSKVRPNNSTVRSCLQILIRIARSSKEAAEKIINYNQLIEVIMTSFLPKFNTIDLTLRTAAYYDYPQHLCLKLIRVLLAHHIDIAQALRTKTNLLEILLDYLQPHEILKNNLIRVQIESLRIVRSMLLLNALDMTTFSQFLPALRYMLDWHLNHCVFKVGGSPLIRQHAAGLLSAIVATGIAGANCIELRQLLGTSLQDCCSKWLHEAAKGTDLGEYSQATLIGACLSVLAWHLEHESDSRQYTDFADQHLTRLVHSRGFIKCAAQLPHTSIVCRNLSDRRFVHAPLPNVGAVLIDRTGPHLAITELYPVQLLCAVLRVYNLRIASGHCIEQFKDFFCVEFVTAAWKFLETLDKHINRYLATNYFARTELTLVLELLKCANITQSMDKALLFRLSYKLTYCLPANATSAIESMFDKFIFHTDYIRTDSLTLRNWKNAYMNIVKPNGKADARCSLTTPFTQVNMLPVDWPYFYITEILRNYITRMNNPATKPIPEKDILCMTFDFVWHIEEADIKMDIVSPEEKLMYLMIAFMGPNSAFLLKDVLSLLDKNIRAFYTRNVKHPFNFDAKFPNKSKFENVYLLFLKEFEAACYGEQLFASLVLVPMAQKYDKKWRQRVWSEYINSVRFLDCDEDLLIGGLRAYFEPLETDASLLRSYNNALKQHVNLRRYLVPGTVAHKIAEYHANQNK